jgi:hypothetical protein
MKFIKKAQSNNSDLPETDLAATDLPEMDLSRTDLPVTDPNTNRPDTFTATGTDTAPERLDRTQKHHWTSQNKKEWYKLIPVDVRRLVLLSIVAAIPILLLRCIYHPHKTKMPLTNMNSQSSQSLSNSNKR